MAILPNPKRRVPFVLENERKLPKDQQTIFHVLPMTGEEVDEEFAFATSGAEESEITIRFMEGRMKKVVGWDNFKAEQEDGSLVDQPFEAALAMRLPLDVRNEIVEFVRDISQLQPGTAKN